MMGRPSTYTEEIASAICDRIANGESLKSICDDDEMPCKSTVFNWLASKPDFLDKYARARETQADALFDEILAIADDGSNDWMLKKFGEDERWVENGEALRRSQLRIDARKWMASKLLPKKYGDKIAVGGSKDMDPIETKDTTGYDLARKIAFALSANDKPAG